MKKIAYIRISSVDQNEARQKIAIESIDNIDVYFIEKKSGKDRNRPELKKLLSYVREDDIVYIHSLDRLARNTTDLLNIVEELAQKQVILKSVKDNFIFDNSATGKLMLTILSAFAEFERSLIRERQAEGIAIAKKLGKYKGRKKIKINDNQLNELYEDYKKGYITLNDISKRLNISRTTLYRRIKEERR